MILKHVFEVLFCMCSISIVKPVDNSLVMVTHPTLFGCMLTAHSKCAANLQCAANFKYISDIYLKLAIGQNNYFTVYRWAWQQQWVIIM